MTVFDVAVQIAFDDGAADALISAADSADHALRSEGWSLAGAMECAMEDFKATMHACSPKPVP